MLTYLAEMDLACTYAMRRPKLAAECASRAMIAAHKLGRPDLLHCANEFLGAL